MKVIFLAAVISILSTACIAGEETMLLELTEMTVDRTAAQRQRAKFVSNEEKPRTVIIPLWFSPDKAEKNEKNIIKLIRQFPCLTTGKTKHGLKSKPKGILSFTVPKKNPESQIAAWELAQLIVKEKTEQTN